MTINLNIGSNLGDRHANLARAVAMLIDAFAPGQWLASDIVESEPWGFDSDNAFLNQGLRLDIDSDMQPAEILALTRKVEQSICSDPHRHPDGSYRDRVIDIDIITIDHIVMNSPELTLPHPRMLNRPFVLIPYNQINKAE
ncbi:MAG: 2-amino-4-hydroxy-6-hydroxymethyldihydropteridine diphosphokinase [Muribaculaceae bacterium]